MPEVESVPTIKVSTEHDKRARGSSRRLSRSPHPYHRRRGHSINVQGGSRTITRSGLDAVIKPEDDRATAYGNGHTSNDLITSKSTSDSGTDADDESGLILKSLPAPPIKSRKGFIGQDGHGTASPLLTPSYLDDEDRTLALERQLRCHSDTQSVTTDDETRKVRGKFARRRRAEFLRRTSETLLLGFVGYAASMYQLNIILGKRRSEIVTFIFIVVGTYSLYPLRLFGRHYLSSGGNWHLNTFIRIPAAFDPATLLYPVLMPIFVAFSLASENPGVLLPNLVLGISSMPRAILPFHDWTVGQNSFHWMLSIMPLALSKRSCYAPRPDFVDCEDALAGRVRIEELVLLYPLHQALLSVVGYLTTTSLLPVELQLLSVSMINLLLLSESPPSIVLQAMLWIGGVLTYVLCGHVLRWGVALARIPSWRFRHPRLSARDGYGILSALDICKRFSKWLLGSREPETYRTKEHSHVNSPLLPRTPSQESTSAFLRTQMDSDLANGVTERSSADPNAASKSPPHASQYLRSSQRRHTLPSKVVSSNSNYNMEVSIRHGSTRKKPRQLTSLTGAQANALKWCFTGYIFSMIIAIVAVPIRLYAGRQVLAGRDPIGWALGYMFGHVPAFRQSVLRWALEDWIILPEPYNPYEEVDRTTWETSLTEYVQGTANIRLLLCLYYVGMIVIGLSMVLHLSKSVEVDTRRKVFHGMMVVMFLPSTFVDPPFVALAFVLVLALFLLLDLFRASQLPPLSGPLTRFLAPYVDGRDYRGPVVVSHMFLLIGCAIPLWLSLAGTKMVGEEPWEGWEVATRDLSMISGVICVGMGDAAASLIGRRYGRRRWCWSGGKSLEGSCAFAVAVVLGLTLGRAWLLLGGWAGDSGDTWRLTFGKAGVAAAGASLTEAVLTGGNDNVVVPVILWLLVKGLRI